MAALHASRPTRCASTTRCTSLGCLQIALPPCAALQTGPKGKPVNTLYIAHKMKLKREMYFALLLDRKSAGPVMIGCSEVRALHFGKFATLRCCWAASLLGQP